MSNQKPTTEKPKKLLKSRKLWLTLALTALVGGGVFFLIVKDEILPEYAPFSRGRAIAEEAGCFSCHGRTGSDAAFNARTPKDAQAAIDWAANAPLERVPPFADGIDAADPDADEPSMTDLRQWIELGTEGMRKDPRALDRAKENVLTMPGYAEHFSPRDIDDLVAYVSLLRHRHFAMENAKSGFETLSRGEALSRSLGCFSCHGELGQGGVANPGSFKGYIPGFFGKDFQLLTRNGNRDDVREWIRDGIAVDFRDQNILGFEPGVYFTERSAVKMPAYGKLISDEDLEVLVDYCLELNTIGPMGPPELREYRQKYGTFGGPQTNSDANSSQSESLPPGFFTETMKPILEKHCVECHGKKKQENDYRMDQRELAFAGGFVCDMNDKKAFVAGDVEASLGFTYILAKERDEKTEVYPMPPKKRPSMSEEEIAAFRRWIENGLEWPEGVELVEEE